MEIGSKKVDDIFHKNKYIKKYMELHFQKTGEVLSDLEALEYFEKLISLVDTLINIKK